MAARPAGLADEPLTTPDRGYAKRLPRQPNLGSCVKSSSGPPTVWSCNPGGLPTMNTRLIAAALLGSAMLAGCATVPSQTELPAATGYFAQPSTLHLRAPDFRLVSDADYKPAFEQAMAIQQ